MVLSGRQDAALYGRQDAYHYNKLNSDELRLFPINSNQFQSIPITLKKIMKTASEERLQPGGLNREFPGAMEFAGAIGGAMVLSGRQDAALGRQDALPLQANPPINSDELRTFQMISNHFQSLLKKL